MDPIDRGAAIKELRALEDSAEIIPFSKAKEYSILILQDAQKRLLKLPSVQPDDRLAKIADLVEGTIDHFDLDDAMDLLYQIKEVLK